MHTSQISTSAYTPKCARKHTLQGELTLRDAPAQAHTRLSHLPTFSSSISQFLSPALSPRPSPPTSYRHSDALWHHRMVEKCVHVSAQHRGRGRDSLRKWPRSLVCESRETSARVESSLRTECLATGLMFLLNLKTGSTNQITGLLMLEKTLWCRYTWDGGKVLIFLTECVTWRAHSKQVFFQLCLCIQRSSMQIVWLDFA